MLSIHNGDADLLHVPHCRLFLSYAGSLPHIGDAPTQPKMHTSDADPVSFKTGTGAPAPVTHTKDVDYSPSSTSSKPMSSSFYSGTGSGSDSKPGARLYF